MKRFYLLTGAAAIALTLGCYVAGNRAEAAGTKRVDPLLKQAIEETAQPMPEPVEEEVIAEEFIAEEEAPVIEVPPPLVTMESPPAEPAPAPQQAADDMPGVRIGNLQFMPALALRQSYDDNILASGGNEEDDFVTSVNPTLSIRAIETRHDINLDAAYEYRHFLDNDERNEQNISARLHGFVKAIESLTFPFSIGWKVDHEDAEEDLTQDQPDTPLQEETFTTSMGVKYKPGRFGVGLSGHYRKERFDNAIGRDTGQLIVRNDADRDITALKLKTSFDLNPRNKLMLTGTWADRNYDTDTFQNGSFTGPSRDSEVIKAMAGWLFDTEVMHGHLKVGYLDQQYDSAAITDVQDIVGDLETVISLSDLTTLSLMFERSVFEDDEIIQPIRSNKAGATLKYQVNQKVSAGIGGSYENRDFEGLNREDDVARVSLLADYLLTEKLSLGAEYEYSERHSSADGVDYERNIFMVRLNGEL